MLPQLDHVVIHVSDWEISNDFYSRVLGLEVVPRGNGFAYRGSNFQFNCHGPGVETTPLARIPVAPGNSDLCFLWNGTLESAQTHFEECGVAIELGPVARNGRCGVGQSLYFRDPDGSLLEFIVYNE